jgi:hypothetical protein
MRQLLAAALFAGAGLLASGSVQAMPAASVDMGASANITQVAGGCGPHYHPTPYGCRHNSSYYHRPVYHHPVYHRCPPGFRPGPHGCYR